MWTVLVMQWWSAPENNILLQKILNVIILLINEPHIVLLFHKILNIVSYTRVSQYALKYPTEVIIFQYYEEGGYFVSTTL